MNRRATEEMHIDARGYSTDITGTTGNHFTFALRDFSGSIPGADDLDGDDPIKGTIHYSAFIGQAGPGKWALGAAGTQRKVRL